MFTRKRLSSVVMASLSVAVAVLMLACPAPDAGGGEDATVTKVTVTPATKAIAVDKTVQLTATVEGTGNYDKTVTWSSSATAVATVSASGLVKGLKAGEATITATAKGDTTKKATAAITVTEATGTITGITLKPATVTIDLSRDSQEFQLTATVEGTGTFDTTVAWSSDNTDVATVSTSGLVEGIKPGTATITATAEGDKTKEAKAKITVVEKADPSVESVTVNVAGGGEAMVLNGMTLALEAVVNALGGASTEVTWSVEAIDPVPTEGAGTATIAKNDAGATLTATAPGWVVVKATSATSTEYDTKSGTLDVLIYQVDSVTIRDESGTGDPLTELTINTVDTETVTVTVTAQVTGVALGNNTGVTWSVKDGATATELSVNDATGVITAGSVAGTATVVATAEADPAKSAELVVTVVTGTVTNLRFVLPERLIYPTPAADIITAGPTHIADDGALLMSISCYTASLESYSVDPIVFEYDSTGTIEDSSFGFKGLSDLSPIIIQSSPGRVIHVNVHVAEYANPPEERTVEVYWKADPSVNASFTIRIVPPAIYGVAIQKDGKDAGDSFTLAQGLSEQLTALVSSHGMHDDHDDRKVSWESDNTDAVTVSPTGELSAVAPGRATITVESTFDDTKSDTITVNVVAPYVEITIASEDFTLPVGGTRTLTATVVTVGTPEPDKTVTWKSSAPAIVSVIEATGGAIKAESIGKAEITATAGGVSDTIDVTVTPTVTSVAIDQTDPEVAVGETDYKLTATVELAVGYTGSTAVTWASSATNVATINKDTGVVTLATTTLGSTTTITATAVADRSKTATATLTVVAPYVESVTIASEDFTLPDGGTRTLTATVVTVGTPEPDKTVTWKSSAPAIVSVIEATGAITAKSPGTAEITATAGGVDSASVTVTVAELSPATFSVTYNGNTYTATKNLAPTLDESTNIVNIFINEPYSTTTSLNLKVTPTLPTGWTTTLKSNTTYNFSDQDAEIFEISDGTTTGKFRLNIFRKPILIDAKPAGNVDRAIVPDRDGDGKIIKDENGHVVLRVVEGMYENSGAAALSIRRFVQTDYYYVPTVVDGVVTDHPAPTFALFASSTVPTKEIILKSPVRVLRNFITADGNTIFFAGADDGVADDDWPDTGLNTNADVLASLTPNTKYYLHWAVDADNGTFSGSLGEVSTEALPTTEPGTGDGVLKYFGMGGMALHRVSSHDQFSMLALIHLNVAYLHDKANIYGPEPTAVAGGEIKKRLVINGFILSLNNVAFKIHTNISGTGYTDASVVLKNPAIFDMEPLENSNIFYRHDPHYIDYPVSFE